MYTICMREQICQEHCCVSLFISICISLLEQKYKSITFSFQLLRRVFI